MALDGVEWSGVELGGVALSGVELSGVQWATLHWAPWHMETSIGLGWAWLLLLNLCKTTPVRLVLTLDECV